MLSYFSLYVRMVELATHINDIVNICMYVCTYVHIHTTCMCVMCSPMDCYGQGTVLAGHTSPLYLSVGEQ